MISTGPPSLDKTKLTDIKIKVGETLKYNISISGEEPPNAEWTLADKDLSKDKRCKITTDEKTTLMVLENAKRGDSGKCKLTLKNKMGTETGAANVNVVGELSDDFMNPTVLMNYVANIPNE